MNQSMMGPGSKEASEEKMIQGIETGTYMHAMREFMGFVSRKR
jgi:hypothetical protein